MCHMLLDPFHKTFVRFWWDWMKMNFLKKSKIFIYVVRFYFSIMSSIQVSLHKNLWLVGLSLRSIVMNSLNLISFCCIIRLISCLEKAQRLVVINRELIINISFRSHYSQFFLTMYGQCEAKPTTYRLTTVTDSVLIEILTLSRHSLNIFKFYLVLLRTRTWIYIQTLVRNCTKIWASLFG